MVTIRSIASSAGIAAGLLLGFQCAGAYADAAGSRMVDDVVSHGPSAVLRHAPAVTGPELQPIAVVADSSETSAHPPRGHESATTFQVPRSIVVEHEELHADLSRLTEAGGRTGEAAKAVAQVLDPHFAKEDAYALPPLGLLAPLSQGEFDCGMTEVLKMTEKLDAGMPTMHAEHEDITAALGKLSEAAKAENKPEGVRFAEMLTAHAQEEEEILYPAALLVGRYVKSEAAHCAR
jgi:hypothetical protein